MMRKENEDDKEEEWWLRGERGNEGRGGIIRGDGKETTRTNKKRKWKNFASFKLAKPSTFP